MKVYDRKRDADAWTHKVESSRHEGSYVDPGRGRQLFEDFAQEWAAARDWKQATAEKWPGRLARLEPVLGGLRLNQIDKLTLERARNELAKRYVRSTVADSMSVALSIMRAAYAAGRIGRDPTAGIKAPKRRADDNSGQVGPDDIPSKAEALELLTSGPTARARAFWALGLAGLRIGETLGMHRAKIDLAGRTVTVDIQASDLKGGVQLTTVKNERDRTIKVPQLIAVELRRYLRELEGEALFGGSSNGLMWHSKAYTSLWYPTLEAAGMKRRFDYHAGRHWCASTLLAEGAPVTAVARHLGDTIETVSKVYSHWLRDEEDVPSAVLDRVLAPETEGVTALAVSQP